jgi:hypothetical protein
LFEQLCALTRAVEHCTQTLPDSALKAELTRIALGLAVVIDDLVATTLHAHEFRRTLTANGHAQWLPLELIFPLTL